MKSVDILIIIAIIAVLTMMGITAILVIELKHPFADSNMLAVMLLGFISPTILSLLTLIKGYEAVAKSSENSSSIADLKATTQQLTEVTNGTMQQLVQTTAVIANAQGRRDQANENNAATVAALHKD